MAAAVANMAFFLPGAPEMVVILLVGVMLFGRRLPEVGRTVGKTMIKMRQGLNKLKEEIDFDDDIKGFKDSIQDVKDNLTESLEAPRRHVKNTGRMLMDLTDESLSVPSPTDATEFSLTEIREDLDSALASASSDSAGDASSDSTGEDPGPVDPGDFEAEAEAETRSTGR